jgi:uncharacterized protein DUF6745
MITQLTKEQQLLIGKVRNEWVDFALFSGDDVDEKAIHEGIDFLYDLTGLKKPVKIIVDSPLAVQYAIPYAKALLDSLGKGVDGSQVRSQVGSQVRSQVDSQVYSQVGSQVRSQVYSQVRSQVYSQVGSQVRSQVDSQVDSQVYSQVDSQVDSQVGSQVDSQVGSQVDSQVGSAETFAWNTLAFYAGWCAYLDYFKRIGVVKYEKFDEYLKYMKSGQFMGVYLDGLAIVCRRPKAVRRDDELRLHHDAEPAIEWRDGYKLYFIHGQAFEKKMFDRITSQKMTLKEVMNMKNADERTMAFSMLRPDRLLKGVNAKLVHTGERGTRLYSVDNFTHVIGVSDTKQNDTEYCMVMDDASTDRVFLEWVDPEIGKKGNADEAQAAAWGVPLEDYLLLAQEA